MNSSDVLKFVPRARLMLVDDHDLVRRGVRTVLSHVPEWTVCAEAGDSEEALELAAATKPDIAVVDISMPRMSGIDLIVNLKRIQPNLAVLVLTIHDSERMITDSIRSGVRGYVLKSDGAEAIIAAIDALSRNKTYFSNCVSERMLECYLKNPDNIVHDQLTPRERQVIKLVAEGNSNKRVARLLEINVKTVETHRSAAMRKIGAKTSADIALYAARNGLVQV